MTSNLFPTPEPGPGMTPNLPNLAAFIDAESRGFPEQEDDEVSNADSDYLEIQADMAKLNREVEAFLAQQRGGEVPAASAAASVHGGATGPGRAGRGSGRGSGRAGGRGGGRGGVIKWKGQKRGPRKAAEPTPELKLRLTEAGAAYEAAQYDEALALTFEIIRVNAETLRAWQLLAAIFQERGQADEALMAMVFAAHLRHTEPGPWLAAASYALEMDVIHGRHGEAADEERTEAERAKNLETANLCYSAAIRAQRDCIPARIGKGNVCLEQGHATLAVTEYVRVLKMQEEKRAKGEPEEIDMDVIRHLAEASFDSKNADRAIEQAKTAYQLAIGYCRSGGELANDSHFEWTDVNIYVELFASRGEWLEAISAVKALSRWLLGRQEESYWDQYENDDREWDLHDDRRSEVPEFDRGRYPPGSYGGALPLDLRGKLAIYRLKLRQEDEAVRHLSWLDAEREETAEEFADSPWLLKEVANQLFESDMAPMALKYYEIYRSLAYEPDAEALVQQGRCYRHIQDDSAAEECFLTALETDDENIAARFELAKMYESAQEKEEAFILVSEAMSLEAQQLLRQEDLDVSRYVLDERGRPIGMRPQAKPRQPRAKPGPREPGERRPRAQHKYRPRRLGKAEQRKQYEQNVTDRLKEKYRTCQDLRSKVAMGDPETLATYLDAAKELVDDFRSFKDFYPWEKYLQFLGYTKLFDQSAGGDKPPVDSGLAAMAERLQQGLAPADVDAARKGPTVGVHEYRGIPLDDWLDIFVEYAVSLAHANRVQEAYAVCQSARDSVVYKSKESMFLIYVAWASCAIFAGDEEVCVSVARFFMREYQFETDAYRMFAAMCRACQSPVSWYSSGPAQKFMLRQIKRMDELLCNPDGENIENAAKTGPWPKGLDICLLVIYGQILFASTSYTYALNYFMRAYAADPTNSMVNLSIALGYIHHALKRQSDNRQFLLAQGFSFLFRYYDGRLAEAAAADSKRSGTGRYGADLRQEANYNVARCYHQLGIHHLAVEYYRRVLEEAGNRAPLPPALTAARPQGSGPTEGGGGDGDAVDVDVDIQGEEEREREKSAAVWREDVLLEAAVNLRTYCLLTGDFVSAQRIANDWLVL